MWDQHCSWSEAEKSWDEGAKTARLRSPIKELKTLPSMPGITEETAKHLRWKSFKWMVSKDARGDVRKEFLKHPFKYAWNYIKSLFKKKSYRRKGDLFFYGIKDLAAFQELLRDPELLLVVGFSYCHKPFECPAKRFSPDCIHDPQHPVCRQCFIGKAINALPEKNTVPLLIPTVHYIGGKMFELIEKYPERRLVFLITACEMTLEMFGDWGNMVDIPGIGVRLDGRICNTMEAFDLSERGIKPGLTVVLDDTKKQILEIIQALR